MRYPDGGGLSAEGQARREKLRLQAAQMFEQDVDPVQVAQLLRVSAKSAYQWRRRWRAGGEGAVRRGHGRRAVGYPLKQMRGADQVGAVRTIAAGQSVLDPQAR